MTPPDNTLAARPDRRTSPKLAACVIVFVIVSVAVFDSHILISSGVVTGEVLGVGILSVGALVALAGWYAAPPRWLVIYALLWAFLICIVALLLIPDIFQILAFLAPYFAVFALRMQFAVPVTGALATLGLALCIYRYPDRISGRVLQFGMMLFCACGAAYLLGRGLYRW